MKKIICLCLAVLMTVSLFPMSASAAEDIKCYESTGSNAGAYAYTYGRCAKTIKSYLVDMSDRLCRFQYDLTNDEMTVEYYNYDYEFISAKKIDEELPIFGGFYFDGRCFFIVTGQENPEERADVECFRVTKYDQNWNRLDSVGLYDCNTTIPFSSGSLRFAECGDYLLFRTSHRMYKSQKDGKNHQANVTVELNKQTMTITDSFTKVWNTSGGYVSHSFNQFIKVENGKIVAVDHGDAYPRSICLLQYTADCSNGSFAGHVNSYDILPIYGETGDNDTGCTVGGFEISNSSYIVVGTSVEQNEEHFSDSIQNVYVSVFSKQNGGFTTNFITVYDDVTATCPFLVKISDTRFLIMWKHADRLCYAELDANGNMTSEIFEADAALSDCQPIVCNENVVWYVWNGNEVSFFELNTSNMIDISVKSVDRGHEYNVKSVISEDEIEIECEKCGLSASGTILTSDDFSLWTYETVGGWFWGSSSIPTRLHPDTEVCFYVNKYWNKDFNGIKVSISDSDIARISPMDGYGADYFKLTFVKEGSVDIVLESPFVDSYLQTYTINVSHDYQTTVLKEATCSENGEEMRTCTTCDFSSKEATAALGHDYSSEWTVDKAPTVISEGSKSRHCTRCGNKTDVTKIDVLKIDVNEDNANVKLSADKKSVYATVGQSVGDVISVSEAVVVIYNADGIRVSFENNIASGMKIVLEDEKGNAVEEKIVVVPGDVDGDGGITAADARMALRASVMLEVFNDWQNSAAKVDGEESSVSASDARRILRASVELEKIGI